MALLHMNLLPSPSGPAIQTRVIGTSYPTPTPTTIALTYFIMRRERLPWVEYGETTLVKGVLQSTVSD
jgi:hypothetical protein